MARGSAARLLILLLLLPACAPSMPEDLRHSLDRLQRARDPAAPLADLRWLPLAPGHEVSPHDVLLTGSGGALVLEFPAAAAPEPERRSIQEGKLLGYRPEGDLVMLRVPADTYLPGTLMTAPGRVREVQGSAWRAPATGQRLRGEKPLSLAPPPPSGAGGALGFTGQALEATAASSLGLREGTTGVRVTSVTPDSPAGNAGLKAGDVILAVDGKPVPGPRELAGMLRPPAQIQVLRWPEVITLTL